MLHPVLQYFFTPLDACKELTEMSRKLLLMSVVIYVRPGSLSQVHSCNLCLLLRIRFLLLYMYVGGLCLDDLLLISGRAYQASGTYCVTASFTLWRMSWWHAALRQRQRRQCADRIP